MLDLPALTQEWKFPLLVLKAITAQLPHTLYFNAQQELITLISTQRQLQIAILVLQESTVKSDLQPSLVIVMLVMFVLQDQLFRTLLVLLILQITPLLNLDLVPLVTTVPVDLVSLYLVQLVLIKVQLVRVYALTAPLVLSVETQVCHLLDNLVPMVMSASESPSSLSPTITLLEDSVTLEATVLMDLKLNALEVNILPLKVCMNASLALLVITVTILLVQ